MAVTRFPGQLSRLSPGLSRRDSEVVSNHIHTCCPLEVHAQTCPRHMSTVDVGSQGAKVAVGSYGGGRDWPGITPRALEVLGQPGF